MGWIFPCNKTSKEEIVERIKNNIKNDSILDYHVSGSEFWVLYVAKDKDNVDRNFLCVIKMKKMDGSYGYSSGFDVQANPYSYSVPKRMVNRAYLEGGYAQDWLKTWQEINSKENKIKKEQWKQLKSGQKFYVPNGTEYNFVREYSKQSVVGECVKTHILYRVKKKDVLLTCPEKVS